MIVEETHRIRELGTLMNRDAALGEITSDLG
jgi:hypothetical protein